MRPTRQLTAKQERVVELVCTGAANKVIAYEMGIAEGTAAATVREVFKKLEVHSRAELIVRQLKEQIRMLEAQLSVLHARTVCACCRRTDCQTIQGEVASNAE